MSDGQASHWDRVYRTTPVTKTGWYEDVPGVSLALLDASGTQPGEPVIDVGCGASTFIDALVARGFRRIIAADVSQEALDRLRERLGPAAEGVVEFVCADLTRPGALEGVGPVAFWHDRAMFHFLTSEEDRAAYLATLRATLQAGGSAAIETFAPEAPGYCSGLPVQRYDAAGLAALLGPGFRLVRHIEHVYRQPSGGLRPYVSALFRRAPAGAMS